MNITKIVTKRGTEYEVGKNDVQEIYSVNEEAGHYNVLVGDDRAVFVTDVVEIYRAEEAA